MCDGLYQVDLRLKGSVKEELSVTGAPAAFDGQPCSRISPAIAQFLQCRHCNGQRVAFVSGIEGIQKLTVFTQDYKLGGRAPGVNAKPGKGLLSP